MKMMKMVLAAALPLMLSAGCALDVGSSAEGLTIERDRYVGPLECGQTAFKWVQAPSWPLATIVAGDMELNQEDLVDYMESHPGTMGKLVAEMAAVQLNLASGAKVTDEVLDVLIRTDDYVMASADDDDPVPPLVALDDFGYLHEFNGSTLACIEANATVAEISNRPIDRREGIVKGVPGTIDIRPGLFKE